MTKTCPPHDYQVTGRVKQGDVITVTYRCGKCGDTYDETECT